MVRVVLRHLSGARSTEADVLDLDAQSEVVIGREGAALVHLDPPSGDIIQLGEHGPEIEFRIEGVLL